MQKKTRLSVFLLFFSALVLCSGCSSFLDGRREHELSAEYGSLSVLGQQNRALDVSLITSARAVVAGSGITPPISVECIAVESGTGSFFIERIPVGRNRVITVQAYDAAGRLLEDGIIRAVVDIHPGENAIDVISRETTCRGNVYDALFESGIDTGRISESETRLLESVIPTLDDCGGKLDRIDIVSIVQDFAGGRLVGKTAESYILPDAPYLRRLHIAMSDSFSAEKPSFRATAVYSDGAERDVTFDAVWMSSDAGIASVAGGAVALLTAGRTEIRAEYTDGGISRFSPYAVLDVSVEEAKNNRIYLRCSGGVDYAKAGAAVAAWIWGKGVSSRWYSLEPASGDGSCLRLELPNGAEGLLFARGRWLSNESSWNGLTPLWNKTADLQIPKGMNTFTPSDWDGASGTWSYVDYGDRPVDCISAAVSMEPSEDDTALSFVAINGNHVPVSNRIVYTVPYETETAEIQASAHHSGAIVSVEPPGAVPIEKGGFVEFIVTVTARDGNKEAYAVKVKRSSAAPLNSEENKKRCYIEDAEDGTITFVYSPDVWNDSAAASGASAITVRGSFTAIYNPQAERWIEDEGAYSLSYDTVYNWYALTLPYESVRRPGYSGQPEYRFYRDGRCLDIPKFADPSYIFNSESMMVLFESDDEARRAELAANSAAASEIKGLSDFNTASEDDMRVVANFRAVPGTTQLYRSYHPFYPTHTDTPTERLRIEQVQALAQEAGIQSDINLCNDRTAKEGLPYTVGGQPYTVTIPDYYKNIIAADSVLYVGDPEHGGNGVVPGAKYVYCYSGSALFGEWVKEIADFIASPMHKAPFQIHCEIGIDRTGVFCAVLAGLCGASWSDIAADYTASNRMGIGEFRDVRALKYSLELMLGVTDVASVADLRSSLYAHFADNGFVSREALDAMIRKLTLPR